MQITMNIEEYKYLLADKEKLKKLLSCISFNYIDFENNIVDKDNPIAVDGKEVYKVIYNR